MMQFMKTSYYFLGLFFLFATNSFGQELDGSIFFGQRLHSLDSIGLFKSMEIPDYKQTPLAPQVALINRYGDYPVDLSTGLVAISIPLHTVRSHQVKMPLELKFHASGLKSDEREGLLGLRWVLGGGGHVSRTVKGYADEFLPFNQQVSNPNYSPDFRTLYGTVRPKPSNAPYNTINTEFTSGFYYPNGSYFAPGQYRDTEYDIFSYTLPSGRNGKFILKDSAGVRIPCLMPYEALSVNVLYSQTTNSYQTIKITDEDGLSYCFGVDDGRPNASYRDSDGNNWPVTWYLTSIVSANKRDTLLIDYIQPNLTATAWDKSIVISDDLFENSTFSLTGGYSCGIFSPNLPSALYRGIGELLTDSYSYFNHNYTPNGSSFYLHAISSIRLKSEGRTQEVVNFSYTPKNGQLAYLNEMTVTNALNNTVKKIKFILKNNVNGNLKLLDKIEFTDFADAGHKEVYSLDYYDSGTVPGYGNLSEHSDWWGYYSANSGWLHSAGNVLVKKPNVSNGGSDYIYKSIENSSIYPNLAGYKNSDVESMKIGMIKSIRYPTGGQTEFEYESNQYPHNTASSTQYLSCGGLRIQRIKNIPEAGKMEIKRYEYGNSLIPIYLLPPVNRFQNLYSENEVESSVRCYYMSGLVEEGYGKYTQRTLQNTFPASYNDFHSNIVYYPDVTEYIENGSGNTGKTVYEYDISIPEESYFQADEYGTDFTGRTDNVDTYKHLHISPKDFWQSDKLSSKTIYNSSGQMLKKVNYEYNNYTKESVFDLPVFKYRYHSILYLGISCDGAYALLDGRETEMKQREIYLIEPSETQRTFGYKHQEYTIGARKLTKETEYDYLNNTISKVKEISYEPKYFLPVEEKITNSDGKVTATAYKYPFNCSNATIAPYTNMTANHQLTANVETHISVDNNLQETGFTNYAYWYANGYYPASFQYKKAGASPETRITYHNYDSYGNPLYISKDNADKVVYLWGYNCQYPIAEIRNVTFSQVTACLSENAQRTIAVKNEPSTADWNTVNGLKTALPDAFITVYKYKPLVGIVEMADPRGIVTKYEYDNFGRLTKTLFNNAAVEDYQYNYKN
jgi:YD repeat-containing protein